MGTFSNIINNTSSTPIVVHNGGTTTISLDDSYLFKETVEYKEIKRQMKLYELSLSAVEEENKKLKKELKDIKKMLLNK